MQRGAQQAEQSLQRVKAAVDSVYGSGSRVVEVTNKIGSSLSNAFQATGGSIQIAQGISQTARAFGDLNTAAGLFSASRVLLEIGKTADDFRQLNGAVRTSGGLWSSLGAIMRAHPLLTIASVIGAAASAMSLFGSSTKNTTTEIRQQASAISEMLARSRELNIRAGYGGNDPRTGVGGTVDVLTQLNLEQDQQRRFGVGQAAGLFGVSELEFRTAMGERGLELREAYNSAYAGSGRYAFSDFSVGEVRYAGERLLERRRAAANYSAPSGIYEFGADRGMAFGGGGSAPYYVGQSAEERARVEEDAAMRVAESMARAADYAEQIGQSFGAAIADVVLGATSLRQALAGLVQSGARQGISSAFGAIFSGISSAAGKTFAQGAGDTGQGFTQPGTIPRSS